MKTNAFGSKIIDNRFIGKTQLNADDLGGAGCSTWDQYRQLCDNIVIASYNRLHGKGADSNILGISVAGLFTLFGVETAATPEYQHRLMVSVISRKPIRSEALKNAQKDAKTAKTALDNAIIAEQSDEQIATLRADHEAKVAAVNALYAEPNNYWFELVPMLDKTKKHASASARKAIEDVLADIINERALMTMEELQAEAQRLADERKGRKLRKKQEAKEAKQAEAEAKAESESVQALPNEIAV